MIAQNASPNKSIQKLESLAQQLMISQGLGGRSIPGERDFVSMASRCIQKVFNDLYVPAGVKPPELDSVRKWFYRGCPDWAIAIINNNIPVELEK